MEELDWKHFWDRRELHLMKLEWNKNKWTKKGMVSSYSFMVYSQNSERRPWLCPASTLTQTNSHMLRCTLLFLLYLLGNVFLNQEMNSNFWELTIYSFQNDSSSSGHLNLLSSFFFFIESSPLNSKTLSSFWGNKTKFWHLVVYKLLETKPQITKLLYIPKPVYFCVFLGQEYSWSKAEYILWSWIWIICYELSHTMDRRNQMFSALVILGILKMVFWKKLLWVA